MKDLQETGYQVVKVFSEKISGFSKSLAERQELQKALAYLDKENVKYLLIHEISRLGRNTTEVLNLLKELETKSVSVHVHNLGITLSAENDSNHIFTKLVITIMADLARMESEQLSLRIKSGIRSRKAQGLHTGRKVNSTESREKFLGKHKEVIKYLGLGRPYSEITKLTGAAPYTISKVKKALAEE
ncbi:recombinase family protein [Nibribacter ruber]|uniref:Recombinase family protein n=1 Tax=Nibribacter ruber TaxID=2698458 RepID=A0A6P1P4X9_9BACT|nr:recombinase family protein [Nibribacter ruber]